MNDLGKKIHIEAAQQSLYSAGDEAQLIQVFTNLVDNALKYGAEGTPVFVTIDATLQDVIVGIKDQGEGISAEHLPRLTERFYRVDSDRSRKLGGTGLGLAIVKHIVGRHRGSLDIASVPGEGSVFTVKLPRWTDVVDLS